MRMQRLYGDAFSVKTTSTAMVHVESIMLPRPDSISVGVNYYLVPVLT